MFNKLSFSAVLLFSLLISCTPSTTVLITGKTNQTSITIGDETITVDDNEVFSWDSDIDASSILQLKAGDQNFEIFVQPGKTTSFSFLNGQLDFSGELIPENNYLQTEKDLNDQINQYLNKNWYKLHQKEESEYITVLDSLKALYFTNLSQSKAILSKTFIQVNTTYVHYAFDRMLLRYPQFHFYFTGKQTTLSLTAQKTITSTLDAPESRFLEAYQKYGETIFQQAIDQRQDWTKDTTTYWDKAKLETTFKIIEEQIKHPELRDFWKFRYIQAHIRQYTWINGQDYLNQFINQCSSPTLKKKANNYQKALLSERKGHAIKTYKTVKGQQLEVHIFRPENFDSTQTYPVLAAFHGGGWVSGHAEWTFNSTQRAAENGSIGMSVEYRLSNKSDITPADALADTRDFMLWLRNNASSLHIDPNKIVAKGISAGGHLVTATAVLSDSLEQTVPNALVLVSPALDTRDHYFKSLVGPKTSAQSLSPLENLKAGINMPPTLILQGQTDNLTPTQYAKAFKTKMDSLAHSCQLVIYDSCGHLFTPSHLDDTGWPQTDPVIWQKAVDQQDLFLKELGYLYK